MPQIVLVNITISFLFIPISVRKEIFVPVDSVSSSYYMQIAMFESNAT